MAVVTFNPDADPETSSVDGEVRHFDASGRSWSSLVSAVGTAAADSDTTIKCVGFDSHSDTNKWQQIHRGIFLFDTSSLPGNTTITAAILSLWEDDTFDQLGATPNIAVYSALPASDTALDAGDFNSLGSTPFSDPIAYGDIIPDAYNDFTLNADGLAAISKTGISKFGLRNPSYDVAGSSPPWSATLISFIRFKSAEVSPSRAPKLVVTHTTGVADAGHIWSGGSRLRFIDEGGQERSLEGTDTGTNAVAGHLFTEGTYCHYVDENGDERREQGTKLGATGQTIGHMWIENANLHYIDASGDERHLPAGELLGGQGFNARGFNA